MKIKKFVNFNLKSALENSLLAIFSSLKSKFSIDKFIAKEIHEIAFRDYYNLYLKSHINPIENFRLYNLKTLKFFTYLLLTFGGLVFYQQIYLKKSANNFWFFAILLILIIVFLSNHLNQAFEANYKKNFLQYFFKFFGDNFLYNENGTNLFKKYQEFHILPEFETQLGDCFDLVTANKDNCHLAIQKIILRNKDIVSKKNPRFNRGDLALMHKKNIPEFINKERITKISEGIAFLVDFDKKFNAKTIIKESKFAENPDPQNLEKIEINNEDFNQNFVVFSNVGIEFNNLFSIEFINAFSLLLEDFKIKAKSIGAKNIKTISASFVENSMLIYIERSESIFTPSILAKQLNLVEESKKIITEFNGIFRVMNAINEIHHSGENQDEFNL